jgi:serine/threonine protein kinase
MDSLRLNRRVAWLSEFKHISLTYRLDSPAPLTSGAMPRAPQTSVNYADYSAVERLALHLDKCPDCGVGASPDEFLHRSLSFALHAAFAAGQDIWQIGTRLSNRYEIIEVIGRGGMGMVYKAKDTELGDRQVAVKEMITDRLDPLQMDQGKSQAAPSQKFPPEVQHFRQEAFLLARFRHPNLPTIFECFSEDEEKSNRTHWYLVMEFIEGETLKVHLSNAPAHKLPIEETLSIGIELCTILDYLHTLKPHQIVYRDLKPSNIMITPEKKVYLIDFGIARFYKPERKSDTTLFVTHDYTPLEQYGNGQTDARSDIYSLGATVYHMLSGVDPEQKNPQPSLLEKLDPPLPTSLSKYIIKMLENDPDKRLESMAEVKENLERIRAALSPLPSEPPPNQPLIPDRDSIPGPRILSSTSSRMLAWRFIGICCLVIGSIFCLPISFALGNFGSSTSSLYISPLITSSLAFGAPLIVSGLALILAQNDRLLNIIEGGVLFSGGSILLGYLCNNFNGSLAHYISDSSSYSYQPMGVIAFVTCTLAIALGCLLLLRWTNVAGGAVMGALLILDGIIIFVTSLSNSSNLPNNNLFGVLCLLSLAVLGIVMIALPVVQRSRARNSELRQPKASLG